MHAAHVEGGICVSSVHGEAVVEGIFKCGSSPFAPSFDGYVGNVVLRCTRVVVVCHGGRQGTAVPVRLVGAGAPWDTPMRVPARGVRSSSVWFPSRWRGHTTARAWMHCKGVAGYVNAGQDVGRGWCRFSFFEARLGTRMEPHAHVHVPVHAEVQVGTGIRIGHHGGITRILNGIRGYAAVRSAWKESPRRRRRYEGHRRDCVREDRGRVGFVAHHPGRRPVLCIRRVFACQGVDRNAQGRRRIRIGIQVHAAEVWVHPPPIEPAQRCGRGGLEF